MEQITTVGIHLAKSVFSLHGVDAAAAQSCFHGLDLAVRQHLQHALFDPSDQSVDFRR